MIRSLVEEDLFVGELVDIDEFIGSVVQGDIDDSDGFGLLVFEETEVHTKEHCPSDVAFHIDIPEEVTHILWYKS